MGASVATAAEPTVLRLLREALGADARLAGALYSFDRVTSTYAITDTFGIEPAAASWLKRELVFRTGEERGVIGVAAERREPCYLEDCFGDPRWFNPRCVLYVRSAYVLPIVGESDVPAVVSLISPSLSGFPAEQRASLDWLAAFAGRAYEVEQVLRGHVGKLERELRRFSLEWNELRAALADEHAVAPDTALRSLSPREWEVAEQLRTGKRVATIAGTLAISPNTVRNHVKAISRKLQVRSRDELRERLSALRVRARDA